MAATKIDSATGASDREIVLTRVFNAPRELVFTAFTDPQHLPLWWGPRGFTITTRSIDVRPGGVWRFVMHGPDGTDYDNKIVYREIARPERLIYAHSGEKEDEPGQFVTTVTFEEQGGRTKLTMRARFNTPEERDEVVEKYGAIEGGKQTLERLGEHLAALAAGAGPEASDREFVISRVFTASRALVWEAWTDPRRLAQWWGPRAFTNPVCELDVRVGGAFRIHMRAPDGVLYPITGVYREVVEPERLVMTLDCSGHPDSWHDQVNPHRKKGGNSTGEMLQTVIFEDLGGQTRLTIRTRLESAAILAAMVKMGMNEGWSQSLDRLEVHLPRIV